MQALYVDPNGGAILQGEREICKPGHGEALVKVCRAGICNTDLEILKGYMGFQGVLGHEFVGQVVSVVDGSNPRGISAGDRVVGEINLTCGTCDVCQLGGVAKRNHCAKRSVLGILKKDGTFAEYLTLPLQNLYKVPDTVTDSQAAFVEPLAAAFRVVEQGLIKPTDSVAVIGDGKLGLLITEVLCIHPHKELVLFGRHENKMALVTGAVKKVLSDESSAEKFKDHFDVCVEASGSPQGIMLASSVTRPLGLVVLKTTCAADATNFNTAPFVVKELTIVGSRCGNFPMAIDALETSVIQVEKYLAKTYPLSDINEALKHAGKRGTLKIQLLASATSE